MIRGTTTSPGWGETEEAGPIAGFVISRKPLILWGPGAVEYPLGLGSSVADRVGDRRAYFLVSPSWHREDARSVAEECEFVRAAQAVRPQHRFMFLCATRRELHNYRDAGLAAAICIKNVFVDETVFDISDRAPKRFDAIYNAAIAPYKRHELCAEIDRLALLYYRHLHFVEHEAEHVRKIRSLLSNATFINELAGHYRQFRVPEIPRWLNQARVGLCLSAHEGPMRACIEYLYCGLPVVTTPNVGGRNRVLDPAYTVEAEPTPASVAAAVRALVDRDLDPRAIRRAAIAKIMPDRLRLVRLIMAIFAEEGVRFPSEADWMQLFRRGTWPFKTEEMLFAETPVFDTACSNR